MSKKVLVTGGAGYIGSHTVVELFNSGYEAIILDDFRNSDVSVIERLTKILGRKPQLIQCDVCDVEQLEKAVADLRADSAGFVRSVRLRFWMPF